MRRRCVISCSRVKRSHRRNSAPLLRSQLTSQAPLGSQISSTSWTLVGGPTKEALGAVMMQHKQGAVFRIPLHWSLRTALFLLLPPWYKFRWGREGQEPSPLRGRTQTLNQPQSTHKTQNRPWHHPKAALGRPASEWDIASWDRQGQWCIL